MEDALVPTIKVTAKNARPSRQVDNPGAMDVDVDLHSSEGAVRGQVTLLLTSNGHRKWGDTLDHWMSRPLIQGIGSLSETSAEEKELIGAIELTASIACKGEGFNDTWHTWVIER